MRLGSCWEGPWEFVVYIEAEIVGSFGTFLRALWRSVCGFLRLVLEAAGCWLMEKDCVKRHFFYSSPPNIVDQRTKRRITEHRTDRNRDGHTTVFHNTSDLITIQKRGPSRIYPTPIL